MDNEILKQIEEFAAEKARISFEQMQSSDMVDDVQVFRTRGACPLSPKDVSECYEEFDTDVDWDEFRKHFKSSVAHEVDALVWPEHFSSYVN